MGAEAGITCIRFWLGGANGISYTIAEKGRYQTFQFQQTEASARHFNE